MLVYVGNGSEGYSTNKLIPSKTGLTSKMDISIRCTFFVCFNTIYQNMARYIYDLHYHNISTLMYNALQLATLSQEQKDLLGIKLSEFLPMVLNH